jgi:hypothetical protein
VLSGVDKHLPDVVFFPQCLDDRRDLHEIWPGTDDMQYFHLV